MSGKQLDGITRRYEHVVREAKVGDLLKKVQGQGPFNPTTEFDYDHQLDKLQNVVQSLGRPRGATRFVVTAHAVATVQPIAKYCSLTHTDYEDFKDALARELFPYSPEFDHLRGRMEGNETVSDVPLLLQNVKLLIVRLRRLALRWDKPFPFSEDRTKQLVLDKLEKSLKERVVTGDWRSMKLSEFFLHVAKESANRRLINKTPGPTSVLMYQSGG